MGIGRSSPKLIEQLPPQKLSDFKQLAIAPAEYNIPEIPQKRNATDKLFLVSMAVSLIMLFIFLIYTLSYADIRRLRDYDQCGNICGEKNEYVSGVNCSGKDMTKLKYLKTVENETQINNYTYFRKIKECVEFCNPPGEDIRYVPIGHKCEKEGNLEFEDITDESNKEILDGLGSSVGQIIALTAFSVGLCLLLMILFRYATACLIWGTLIGCYMILIICTMYMWFTESKTYYIHTTLTVISVVVTILLISTIKRIPLVIGIFREATKAIFSMPLIVFEPLLTTLAFILALLMFVITTVYMLTAGELVKTNTGSTDTDTDTYEYQMTPAMNFTLAFNGIMLFWILKFIMGCQIMVISGAISSYYFARDKTFLGDPIRSSFKTLIKYHLGSVALGSLLLTIADIIKTTLNSLEKYRRTQLLVMCCSFLHTLLTYISTNAYIQIAMHGENFFRSGRRAVQLIFQNLSDIVAINSLGDFVLFMAKLFVVLLTTIFGFLISSGPNGFSVFLSGICISAFLANCVFRVFETAIDTIFMCYCEDCQINDGDERPYYMSTELMQLIQESKSVMAPAAKSAEQQV